MEKNKSPKASIFFFLLLLLSISSCSGFNITKLLQDEDDFSTFSQHLSETKLANEINKRSTITVLAVDNGAIGGLDSDKSVMKAIMSVHVILDYYDKEKLTKLAKNNKSTTLTTLYQSSGLARDQQGFVRIQAEDGEIKFGSASKGADMNSKLVKSVISQRYNISVLQVSSIIGVPNINASPSPEKAPAPAPSPKKGKSPSPDTDDDTADAPDTEDTADSPDSDDYSDAPSPSKNHSPPEPDEDDNSPSPGPEPEGISDAHATAAEMGLGVVAMGLISISILVGFF